MDIALRVLLALLGSYVLANLGAVAFAALLPLARVDAALVSIQLSFALYACAVVWVFAARTAWRAMAGLLLMAAVCLPVVMLVVEGVIG
ncbi:iron transporter [Pseudomonas sp. WN033]|nr:iron transporter [Pseudomonas sp. WN033]